jgi:hypothetical protein
MFCVYDYINTNILYSLDINCVKYNCEEWCLLGCYAVWLL